MMITYLTSGRVSFETLGSLFMNRDEITILLRKASGGDTQSAQDLYQIFYKQIKDLAIRKMASEREGHTLGATALVNEAYLKLLSPVQVAWEDRRHFLHMASKVMRQILIDHARSKNSIKRGGLEEKISFDEDYHFSNMDSHSLIELDDALKELAIKDERKAKIVELKFFGGFSNDEIADLLSLSQASIKRDWAMAKSWLYQSLRKK